MFIVEFRQTFRILLSIDDADNTQIGLVGPFIPELWPFVSLSDLVPTSLLSVFNPFTPKF